MKQYKNIHNGDRCYILGNGPSLNDVDLPKLLNDGFVFGSNRIYLSGMIPDYYACVNPLVYGQFKEEIDAMDTVKFLPESMGGNLDTSLTTPMFSSPEGPIWEGHTVTFVLLQLAYYMGFGEIILLGLDHYYGDQGRPNMEVVATGPDPHHFSSSYFSNGTRWHTPDLARSELAYSLAKAAFDNVGTKVYNCSSRTKLNVFPILPLNYVRSKKKFRVSAICSAYYAEQYIDGFFLDQSQIIEKNEIVIVCQKGSVEHTTALQVKKVIPQLVTIIETEDVPTIYRAWNLGVQFASGKYLTNANTDDRHHPLAYGRMADVLDARPDIDLVYHDSYITWENESYNEFLDRNDGVRLEAGRFENKPGIFAWPDYSRDLLGHGCFIGPHPMWRANLHQKHGGFLDHYKVAGDYEFWLRTSARANFLHIPYPWGLYHAGLGGAELKNPEIAAEESSGAIMLHQEPSAEVSIVDESTLRICIGGNWTYININELYSMLERSRDANV